MILHLTSTEQAKTSIRLHWDKIAQALNAGKHLTMEIKLASKEQGMSNVETLSKPTHLRKPELTNL